MPSLARGQVNTNGVLNWFTTFNGVLTDAYEVGWQIVDVSGNGTTLPGTQVWPTTPGAYETAGRFDVGSYWAAIAGVGFTPGGAEPLGPHRIKWRWKLASNSPYQAGFEDFDVYAVAGYAAQDTYCVLQDVRDAGVTTQQAADGLVLVTIALWQQFIERACRQWFLPKTLVISLDGTDSDTLHLPVPIISVANMWINGEYDNRSPIALETKAYSVYNGRTLPDDRKNPRIKLRRGTGDIYTSPIIIGPLRFAKGRKNQTISGVFGFVEEDGTTPALIKRALLKLVVEKLALPVVGSSSIEIQRQIAGVTVRERTDDHEIQFAQQNFKAIRPGLSGITNDPEILKILTLYKAPIGMAVPANYAIQERL